MQNCTRRWAFYSRLELIVSAQWVFSKCKELKSGSIIDTIRTIRDKRIGLSANCGQPPEGEMCNPPCKKGCMRCLNFLKQLRHVKVRPNYVLLLYAASASSWIRVFHNKKNVLPNLTFFNDRNDCKSALGMNTAWVLLLY